MNRSKNIGTAAESAVVRYLQQHGFYGAERRALHGNTDLGDVTGCGPIVFEVKGGQAAKTASDGQVTAWLEETETERRNANADVGVLVMARAGIGPNNAGNWWAVVPLHQLNPFLTQDAPVRVLLRDAVVWLRECGHGDPFDPDPYVALVAADTDEERAEIIREGAARTSENAA